MVKFTPQTLKKLGFNLCRHKAFESCSYPVSECCNRITCSICLKLTDDYTDELIDAAEAEWNGEGYVGTVGSHSFSGIWSREYDRCVFTVTIDEGEDAEQILTYYLCPEDGETGASCMNPSGSAAVSDGLITWQPTEWMRTARRTELGSCKPIEVAFVLDITGSMFASITALKEGINSIVTTISSEVDAYRLSLLTFRDSVTTDVAFADNNGAALTTAINGLTVSGGGQFPEAGDHALRRAVDQEWLTDSHKVIVYLSDAVPGGYNDVADSEDYDRFIQAATDAGNHGKLLLTFYPEGTGSGSVSEISAAKAAQRAAATAADGQYFETTTGIATAISEVIAGLCSVSPCKHPFCGECDCVPKFLCVEVAGEFCTNRQLVEVSEDFNDCGELQSAVWAFSIECGDATVAGEISIRNNVYTNTCEIVLTTDKGTEDEAEQVLSLDDCKSIEASFTMEVGYETFDVLVTDAVCETCEPKWGICYCGDRVVEQVRARIYTGLTGVDPIGEVILNRTLFYIEGCQIENEVPACRGFYGSAILQFPIGMGQFEENGVELRIFCNVSCAGSSCIQLRFSNRTNGDGWNSLASPTLVDEIYQCDPVFIQNTGGTGSACWGLEGSDYTWDNTEPCDEHLEYQITEILFEEI